MTLIITAINRFRIVQVSDRRLTRGQNIVDDDANKAICVVNQNSKFSIAYTGLAEIKINKKVLHTDEWIVDYLASIDAGSLSMLEITRKLVKQLTSTMRTQKWKLDEKGLTLAITGFYQGKTFVGGISNMEDNNGNRIPIENKFSSWIKILFATANSPCLFMVNGLEDVLNETFWPRIKKKGKEIANKSSEKIAQEFVSMIRWAAHHKTLGKYIGQNCMSTIIPFEGDFVTSYHPLNASAKLYSPHLLVPGMAFKKIGVWRGKKPPWWKDQ